MISSFSVFASSLKSHRSHRLNLTLYAAHRDKRTKKTPRSTIALEVSKTTIAGRTHESIDFLRFDFAFVERQTTIRHSYIPCFIGFSQHLTPVDLRTVLLLFESRPLPLLRTRIHSTENWRPSEIPNIPCNSRICSSNSPHFPYLVTTYGY